MICRDPALSSLDQRKDGATHVHGMFCLIHGPTETKTSRKQPGKKVYTMVFYNQRDLPKTQAPAAAAQDSGTSIRQLIKTP